MGIQRYVATGTMMRHVEGGIVLFTDHLEDVRQQLFHLLSTLADIRRESGLGDGPMLSELAGEVGKIKRERDELALICAEVGKNLGIENDDDPAHLPNHAADVSADKAAGWNAWRKEASKRNEIVSELYTAKRERDEAVEALRSLFDVLEDARDHLQYTGYGDSYERSAARQERLPERIAEALEMSSAALAKIGGR